MTKARIKAKKQRQGKLEGSCTHVSGEMCLTLECNISLKYQLFALTTTVVSKHDTFGHDTRRQRKHLALQINIPLKFRTVPPRNVCAWALKRALSLIVSLDSGLSHLH